MLKDAKVYQKVFRASMAKTTKNYFPLKLHTPHPNATNHMSPTSNTVDNIMGASLGIHSGTVNPLPKPPQRIDSRKVDYDPR